MGKYVNNYVHNAAGCLHEGVVEKLRPKDVFWQKARQIYISRHSHEFDHWNVVVFIWSK